MIEGISNQPAEFFDGECFACAIPRDMPIIVLIWQGRCSGSRHTCSCPCRPFGIRVKLEASKIGASHECFHSSRLRVVEASRDSFARLMLFSSLGSSMVALRWVATCGNNIAAVYRSPHLTLNLLRLHILIC